MGAFFYGVVGFPAALVSLLIFGVWVVRRVRARMAA
jgi:hypothetical protein